MPGIAPNVLAARLRKLEAERIVVSVPYSTRPVRHTYELTADGRELAGALAVLGVMGGAGRGCPARRALPRALWHRARAAPLVPDLRHPVDDADADDLDRL